MKNASPSVSHTHSHTQMEGEDAQRHKHSGGQSEKINRGKKEGVSGWGVDNGTLASRHPDKSTTSLCQHRPAFNVNQKDNDANGPAVTSSYSRRTQRRRNRIFALAVRLQLRIFTLLSLLLFVCFFSKGGKEAKLRPEWHRRFDYGDDDETWEVKWKAQLQWFPLSCHNLFKCSSSYSHSFDQNSDDLALSPLFA